MKNDPEPNSKLPFTCTPQYHRENCTDCVCASCYKQEFCDRCVTCGEELTKKKTHCYRYEGAYNY